MISLTEIDKFMSSFHVATALITAPKLNVMLFYQMQHIDKRNLLKFTLQHEIEWNERINKT